MRKFAEEQDIINGIRNRDGEAFEYIFDKCYDVVDVFVTSNSGSAEDVKDIYNESIYCLIELVDDPNLQMRAKVTTLFIAICRKQWYRILEKRRSANNYLNKMDHYETHEDQQDELDDPVYSNILWESFSNLNVECQKVLIGYLQQIPVKTLAEILGLSPQYLKKKKHFCHKKLLSLVKEHPDYVELYESEELKIYY